LPDGDKLKRSFLALFSSRKKRHLKRRLVCRRIFIGGMVLDYTQALHFIHGLGRFGSRPGLARVTELLSRLGEPQRELQYVHVAGTNGKGSTCAMVANTLTRAGARTGLYISPFVLDFRERLQVDGEMIAPEELAAYTAKVKAVWDTFLEEDEKPTEFEVLFAVAVEFFRGRGCDVVVLEVGMGGRLDATNAIPAPLVAVITSIGIDHTEYLGDTIAKIAGEKCGILKRGSVCVTYPRQEVEALAAIMEHCAALDIPLYMGGTPTVLEMDITGSRILYEEVEYHIPLGGKHQIWNAVTALEAVKALCLTGFAIPVEAARKGIAATAFPSRLEILGQKPLILLDGAHNLAGARSLGQALSLLGERRVHCVMGMLADKDVAGCLGEILPHCASVAAVTPDNPRALPGERLAAMAKEYCRATWWNSPPRALQTALDRCEGDDAVLICGSLFLAAELRPAALEWVRKNNGTPRH